jgi:hypothetical protein
MQDNIRLRAHTHNCGDLLFQMVTPVPFVGLEPSYVERSQPSPALAHWNTLTLVASSWRQGDQTTPSRAPWIASNDRHPAVQLWTCNDSSITMQPPVLTDLAPILRQPCQSWPEKAQQQVKSLGQKMSLRRSKGSKGVPWWQSGSRVRL